MNSGSVTWIITALIIGAVGGYFVSGGSSAPTEKTSMQPSTMSAPLTIAATDSDKIQNAMSAAPETIGKGAAVIDWPGADGMLRELRKGTNGWTCLPDYPASPGNDPLCGDAMTMEWFQSYLKREAPSLAQAGISYMLQGASDASNEDPFADSPPPGKDWMSAGPHIMIFPQGSLDEKRYGTTPGDKPWVMFAGTPYEHLMIPVQ